MLYFIQRLINCFENNLSWIPLQNNFLDSFEKNFLSLELKLKKGSIPNISTLDYEYAVSFKLNLNILIIMIMKQKL